MVNNNLINTSDFYFSKIGNVHLLHSHSSTYYGSPYTVVGTTYKNYTVARVQFCKTVVSITNCLRKSVWSCLVLILLRLVCYYLILLTFAII